MGRLSDYIVFDKNNIISNIMIIIILVINVTAACVRGCAARVGLLVTGNKKRKGGEQKRTTESKSTLLMGDTENYKGDVCVCVGGGGGG